jgi:tetratricopeptide (TPR) repeat protein
LNRFGLALWRLQNDGWLDAQLAAEEFQDSLRLSLGAYPFPDRWVSFWRHVLWRDHRRGDISVWVRGLLPQVAAEQPPRKAKHQVWATYDADWPARASNIAEWLRQGVEDAVDKAEQLLAEQRNYFDRSGDSSNLVRSATQFSAAIRRNRPTQALIWARLAKDVEPWDTYAWNNEGQALLALGDLPSALGVLREAVDRFPDEVVIRNAFARVLKVRRWREEAEAEYREIKERFPDNVYARTGLAEVLRAQRRLGEAEAEYRETKVRFRDDVVARNGLAEVLKAQDRLDEAEAEYRETKRLFPDNVFARNGLAEVLKAQDRLDEAEAEYRETKELFPNNVYVRDGLARVFKARGRLAGAEQEYRRSKEEFPNSLVPRNNLISVFDDVTNTFDNEPLQTESTDDDVVGETTFSAGVVESETSPHEAPVLDRREIKLIATDAFLIRSWARTTKSYCPDLALGHFRERAEDLLNRLLPAADRDSIAASESALLELDRGELDQALALLRRAVERFPGSARVRYALARAEREAAQADPITPWRRLLRLDEHYEPIFFLGVGRACLNRATGDDGYNESQARDKLGRLAFWIRQRTVIDTDCDLNDTHADPRKCFLPKRKGDFAGWWAVETQAELFGTRLITGYDDLLDLGPIKDGALRNVARLDRLEEELVLRYARA